MSVTYRLLLALVLTPDVWDLSSVVQRCYRLCVTPLAMMLCSTSLFWCTLLEPLDCCSRWQNHCTYRCSTITTTSSST